jgi:hypothetical protein
VEDETLQRLAPLRDDEKPDRRPSGGEGLLDRPPPGDQLLPFLQ